MAATKMFFRSGFDMQVFQIWKTSETTYLFFRSGFDMHVFQIWKTSGTTNLLVV
uniref:Uncharacterized protein n=1 Tax=Brassica oleracea var. oleracea TaxID=109376 RepID=A0A0D3BJE5_BRAOL